MSSAFSTWLTGIADASPVKATNNGRTLARNFMLE